MAQVMDTIGDIVAGILGSPPVVIGSRAILLYLAILWIASAWWVYRDLRRRTRDPITPYVAAGAVVVFTPLFFPLAVVAYRIVRPQETVAERRERDLEQLLIVDQARTDACPSCRRPVEGDWIRCPTCATTIGSRCADCGGRVEPDWSVCPWCAADVEVERPVAISPSRRAKGRRSRTERGREHAQVNPPRKAAPAGVPPIVAAE